MSHENLWFYSIHSHVEAAFVEDHGTALGQITLIQAYKINTTYIVFPNFDFICFPYK